jgi:hypothetical protein
VNPVIKKFVIKEAWLLDEHKNKIAELTWHNPDEVFKDVVDKENIRGGKLQWEITEGEHKGKDIWKGHCEVIE